MTKLLNGYCRALEWLLVALLWLMVVLVFGNVVMRYAFNSGITMSEEVSRWLFVWLTFMALPALPPWPNCRPNWPSCASKPQARWSQPDSAGFQLD